MADSDHPRPPRMPFAELRRAAEIMYGPDWQSPLARDLEVSLRNVQRWAAGEIQPPDVRTELALICQRRAKQLAALADRLNAQCGRQ